MLLILTELKKLASIFFVLLFISCSNEYRPTIYSHSGKALGTSFKILYSANKPLKNIDYFPNYTYFEI